MSGKTVMGKLAFSNALNEEHIVVVLTHRGQGRCGGKAVPVRAVSSAESSNSVF